MFRCAIVVSGVAVFVLLICIITALSRREKQQPTGGLAQARVLPQITIQTKLLEPNKYSRPQLALEQVRGVVVHYTANPGTNALENRNYFNNLPKINEDRSKPTYASSHFIIGLEGQIIQCIPLEEMAYASNDRNSDTISIECCHPDETGKFNKSTYQALVELVTYLCIKYDLEAAAVIRHYDVTGKLCPLYFVKHEDKWDEFQTEIERKLS